MLDMRSEEIEQLLSSLKDSCITDNNVVDTLQKIRSDAMATKGGVQRLVKLACVQRVLKLLYRYVILDKSETEAEKSANEKNINTALSIVANLLMEKDARKQVKRDGMETLVSLLNDCHSEEVKIRCCRSMSNLAMDLPARSAMTQVKVVPALIKVLEVRYVEVEKPAEADTKAKDKEEESANEDVEVEAKFPSSAIVDAACKVARYIVGDSKVRQQCLEAGMVGRLAMLIKAEDSRLVAFVLRTLSELWTKMNKRITENMASEVSRAGIMAKLLEFVDSKDDKVSQQAFTILLPLAGHPRSAALIGASDGVEFFISHLNSPRPHIVHKELISGLCLLAKEAVNRVKLRESGGLKVFLEALQDDAMLDVQDRVISCLVSFLYDDTSLSTMLSEGLVRILLSHLQRSGNYTSDMSVNLFTSAQALLLTETSSTEHDTSKDSPQEDTTTDNSCNSDRLCPNKEDSLKTDSITLSKTQSEILIDVSGAQDETCNKNTDTAVQSLTDSTIDVGQKPASSEAAVDTEEGSTNQESEETAVTSRSVGNHTYSMNSPTYQAETTWRMEDYHPGVTCKSYNTSFSPNSPASTSDDSRNSFYPNSPLSTHSYYSPSTLQHSPLSSPGSSPAYSSATLSPAHSPCISQGFASPNSSDGVGSEDLTHQNPSPISPPGHSFHSAQSLVFSSSEEEDCAENTNPGIGSDNITGSSTDTTTVPFTKVRFHLGQDETDPSNSEIAGNQMISHPLEFLQDSNDSYYESAVWQARQGHETGCRFFRLPDHDCEPAAKKQKLRPEAGVHGPITQNNILILLSRLSVRDDLSQHLASPNVLTCLTDHLASAEEPHDRCERILSRVMTNPHCFNPLLNMCAPAIVVRTLMLDCDLKLVSHEAIASVRRSASGNRISRHLSVEDKDMRSRIMNSGASPNLSSKSRGAKPKSQSNASFSENLESSSPGKHSISRMLSCDPAHDDVHSNQLGLAENSPGDKKCNLSLARMGSVLLEDLSSQASSPYGEGVILHTFHCLTPARQLMCAASLLFLQSYWTRERRQKFLIQQKCLDKVVSALCTRHSTNTSIKDALGLGLVYLARSLHIPCNFQSGDIAPLFTEALQSIQPPTDTALITSDHEPPGPRQCNYAQAEKDLQIKIQKESCCHVLHAKRDMLVRNASVFSAMLQGSYIESTQSEISLSDVCPKAMASVLHYLHHCGDQCSVLTSLADISGNPFGMKTDQSTVGPSQTSHPQNKTDKNKHLKHVLNMLVIADRFLLSELRQFLASVVSVSLVGANCVEEVFQFSAFHGLTELAEDCMQVLLSSPSSVADVTSSLTTLAEGQFGTCVMNSILSLVKRGIAHTP